MNFPIPKRDRTGAPATAQGAAGQAADGVKELMRGVGFPMRGLAATSDDHSAPRQGTARHLRKCSGEVHEHGNPAKDPVAVVRKAHHIPQTGAAPQIRHTLKRRMIMPRFPDLNKMNAAVELIDHLLITAAAPPFNSISRISHRQR